MSPCAGHLAQCCAYHAADHREEGHHLLCRCPCWVMIILLCTVRLTVYKVPFIRPRGRDKNCTCTWSKSGKGFTSYVRPSSDVFFIFSRRCRASLFLFQLRRFPMQVLCQRDHIINLMAARLASLVSHVEHAHALWYSTAKTEQTARFMKTPKRPRKKSVNQV